MKLIFATHNQGKVKEMQALLSDFDIEVMSAEEAGMVEDVEVYPILNFRMIQFLSLKLIPRLLQRCLMKKKIV